MITALIKQDLRLGARNLSGIALGLAFFGLFALLMIITLGSNPEALRPLIGPLIWMAFLLTLLMSAAQVWADLAENDRLEQILLAGVTPMSLAGSRFMAQMILLIIPILLAAGPIALALGLPLRSATMLTLALAIGAPGLLVYTLFAGAAVLRLKRAGLLMILITVPLIIPALIFGTSATQSSTLDMNALLALGGISLLSIGLGLPAIAALLKAQVELS